MENIYIISFAILLIAIVYFVLPKKKKPIQRHLIDDMMLNAFYKATIDVCEPINITQSTKTQVNEFSEKKYPQVCDVAHVSRKTSKKPINKTVKKIVNKKRKTSTKKVVKIAKKK